MASSPRHDPLLPGDPRRLGRWRIVGRLGSGGMGVVFLGRHRQRLAAIKVLRADLADDPALRERFRREAAAASRVVSTHTARVVEVGDGKVAYLASEYVEGPTLARAIAERGPMRGAELRELARGIAHAIAAMHAAGITHRDLTPSNVILDRHRPVVIDFGIARTAPNRTMTATGWAIGTPGWMAPEQATGERAGPEADLFAWGLLVAYAGTGRAPFGTGRPDAVVYRIVHETPDLGGLDHTLVPIVVAALEKDPARRPLPEPVLYELAQLDAPEPATAPTAIAPVAVVPTQPVPARTPPERPDRVRRRRFSPRAAVGVLAVVALLVAAGAGGVWLARLDDDSAAADADESTPSTGVVPTSPTVPATAPPTTAPPTTAAAPVTDPSEYCDAASEYYDRLDDAQSDLGLFPDQDELDESFVAFAADNQELGAELRATAPDAIAGDVDVVIDAFELAGDGDLSGYLDADYDAARGRIRGYELVNCQIFRFN